MTTASKLWTSGHVTPLWYIGSCMHWLTNIMSLELKKKIDSSKVYSGANVNFAFLSLEWNNNFVKSWELRYHKPGYPITFRNLVQYVMNESGDSFVFIMLEV